jgi:hypothetical protein
VRAVLALVVLFVAAGCIEPSTSSTGAPECAVPAIGTTGAHVVHVELANTMARGACVQLFMDGVLVAGKGLPAETSGLHANPGPAGDVRWARESVLVRIQEAGTDHAYEERVTLGGETWVVGWLDEGGGNVETYDRQPMWM